MGKSVVTLRGRRGVVEKGGWEGEQLLRVARKLSSALMFVDTNISTLQHTQTHTLKAGQFGHRPVTLHTHTHTHICTCDCVHVSVCLPVFYTLFAYFCAYLIRN